jgi:putative addiction module component (TIGR02574 family)
MTSIAEQLKSQLAELSEQDRAELAHFLIGSLDGSVDPEAESRWDEELSKRGEQILKGTETGVPADQVFSRLREKYA